MLTGSCIRGWEAATGVEVEEERSEALCALRGWIVGDVGVAGMEVLYVAEAEGVLRSTEPLADVLEASSRREPPLTIMWC
jgi:hypothetical protein